MGIKEMTLGHKKDQENIPQSEFEVFQIPRFWTFGPKVGKRA